MARLHDYRRSRKREVVSTKVIHSAGIKNGLLSEDKDQTPQKFIYSTYPKRRLTYDNDVHCLLEIKGKIVCYVSKKITI